MLEFAQSVASGNLHRRFLGDPFAPPGLDPIVLADPAGETQLLTVHLSLDDTEPLVWRRLSISGDLDFAQVLGSSVVAPAASSATGSIRRASGAGSTRRRRTG